MDRDRGQQVPPCRSAGGSGSGVWAMPPPPMLPLAPGTLAPDERRAFQAQGPASAPGTSSDGRLRSLRTCRPSRTWAAETSLEITPRPLRAPARPHPARRICEGERPTTGDNKQTATDPLRLSRRLAF